MFLLLACTPDPAPVDTVPADTAPAVETAAPDETGSADTSTDTEEVEEITGEGSPEVFDPETIHALTLTLSDAAIAALREEPTEWVSGEVAALGQTFATVGVRVKGSASFQDIDHKPALKLKFHEYDPDQRFFGLERLTLNNEVWDPTMMAENLSYEAWRDNGAPAPRTGYAAVTLNGRYLGLYAILESMDDDFIDHQWPGSEGGLWEMTRDCDFTSDCDCFSLQATGSSYVEGAITRGCEAAAAGTLEALQGAFDWEALIAFLAVEFAVNHPDSYSYNLNNFFIYHDPASDRLSLSPWGADSTFIYAYPPSTPNPTCEPLYRDVLTSTPKGWLMGFCLSNSDCRADLSAKVLEVADWMEESNLVGRMEATAERLDPYAALETEVNWTLADRKQRLGCFIDWTKRRPAALRDWAQ